MLKHTSILLAIGVCGASVAMADDFRVLPYLQNPSTSEMTVRWLSNSNVGGSLTLSTPGGPVVYNSTPVLATTLGYNPYGSEPGGPHPALPYMHSVRISGLTASTSYNYSVNQNGSVHSSTLTTAVGSNQAVRFMVFADSETEPESTGSRVTWPAPAGVTRPAMYNDGKYFVDQTTGFKNNLNVIASRNPNFISIAGDLVESGGEQRDWDEFWKHFAGDYGDLAGRVPLMNSMGNHENFGGPGALGGYSTNPSNFAAAKFTTYFEAPANGASNPVQEGRYSRRDYGKVTLITLDSSNGGAQGTANDTNWLITSSNAPDYAPGSEQYLWAQAQLADAKAAGQIVFVQFHHVPYSVGPHGWPAGGGDNQSGVPMRLYSPLFEQYDVAAVIAGHDEMYEHSIVNGIHYYDVGIGGDGLRGPVAGLTNPFQVFLAHDDAPEVWSGNQLVSGGKHYGHLEVNVTPLGGDQWQVQMLPVYVFPLMDTNGTITGWERRVYDDVVTLTVPEPASGMLLPLLLTMFIRRRKRTINTL